jgi:hypothetical protein
MIGTTNGIGMGLPMAVYTLRHAARSANQLSPVEALRE